MKYAVGYVHFLSGDLNIEFVDANNWKDALSKYFIKVSGKEEDGDVSWLSDDIEAAKFEAYNADFMFEVKEISE